jgi:hypothetical protein
MEDLQSSALPLGDPAGGGRRVATACTDSTPGAGTRPPGIGTSDGWWDGHHAGTVEVMSTTVDRTRRPPRIERGPVGLATLPSSGVAAYLCLVALVTLLGAVGVLPRWPGLPHLVALPPLGTITDLRWLLAHATGYVPFAIGLMLATGIRITVMAVLLRDRGRPSWRLAIRFHLVALAAGLVVGQLNFVAHAALYSRLFGAATLLTAGVWFLLAAAPWTGEERFRDALRGAARAGFRAVDLGAYVLALAAIGTVAAATGELGAVLSVPVTGAITLLAIARLRSEPPRHPLVGLAVVGALVAAVAAAVIATRGAPWHVSDEVREGSIMLMSGINSSSGEGAIFELRPERLGYTCDQTYYFSYAGRGDGQPQGVARCPIRTGSPYEPEDTQRPFDEQVATLAEQVNDLEPPVVVFAHSQAAWVAWQAAADGRFDGATTIVLVGPFPASPAGYPPPGETGPGRVGGDLFRLLEPVPQLVDFDFIVDAPLAREILATPDAAGEIFGQALPEDVAALAVTSVTDLPLMPDGWRIDGAIDACPLREAHPYLPITPAFYPVVDAFLAGTAADGCPPWSELYRLVARPLGVPPVDP